MLGKTCETCLSYKYKVEHCTLFSCFMNTVSLFIFEDVPKAENHLSLRYSHTVCQNMKRYSNPHTKLFMWRRKHNLGSIMFPRDHITDANGLDMNVVLLQGWVISLLVLLTALTTAALLKHDITVCWLTALPLLIQALVLFAAFWTSFSFLRLFFP